MYFDLNRTTSSVVQEVDIDVDLTAVFSLNKSSSCSSDLNQLNTFQNINITEVQNIFNMAILKQDWSLLNQTCSNLFR